MKNKIFFLLLSIILLGSAGCSKKFLENTKDYNQYGEDQVFSNETLAGWYIDRVYNYFFVSYTNPLQQVVGLYNTNRSNMTEELGGTVINYTDPNKTLQFASDADGYYGTTSSSTTNNPYTRIRFCNDIIEKMDEPLTANLSASFRATAKGQMYFLRAWQYFDLVRVYGGVPIVTTVQNNSTTDPSIQIPRAKSSDCFAQIVKDLDSAAALLPMTWSSPSTNYGRLTAAGALAMKSRVLLTAASPLFNTDWDNPGNAKWKAALQASLDAETQLTAAGYGLYGSSAKDWASMTNQGNSKFNPEALIVFQFSTTNTKSVGVNNTWENSIRPIDYGGSGNGISATKQMLDLFPMANGSRPTAANGYIDTFFFANRDPRFYKTFEFSGEKWGIKGNANKSTWFYRWKPSATGKPVYYGDNQTNSPAIVRKMSDSNADSTGYAYSGTNIFEYRYAELILNIAECYAATGDINDAVKYLGKIRARVGIPSANNYGIGTPATKYEAINDCLYERRVELAYEGKRFWDIQRWMLYDNTPKSGNSVQKLGLTPINGTARNGYYWQAQNYTSKDPLTDSVRNSILIDPDAADFNAQIAALEDVYRKNFVMTPLDQAWDQVSGTPVNILFRPNYYLSGLNSSVLSLDPWITQTEGWLDYSGGAGTYDYQQ
ncbi:RagB/SusD family nutrient uptake outer membrane protein [Arachidicoccus sp.]|uniref:RagB/SusD family nutrient uptake outer membrane protein n=1 Tax=Arachidicoccus sp. TaxID=1872624 RepID=UPI003D253EB5